MICQEGGNHWLCLDKQRKMVLGDGLAVAYCTMNGEVLKSSSSLSESRGWQLASNDSFIVASEA
jgi:hypothetical protein